MTIRFMLYLGSGNNLLAEMHDMKAVPTKGDHLEIGGKRYEVLECTWILIPRDSDGGAYRSGPEQCSVMVLVRRAVQ